MQTSGFYYVESARPGNLLGCSIAILVVVLKLDYYKLRIMAEPLQTYPFVRFILITDFMLAMRKLFSASAAIWLTLAWATASQAQNSGRILSQNFRPISTAVPFLIITPDSRAGGMGEAGVATSPDLASSHWNPAKLAFMEQNSGFGISYNPWLASLVNDMWLAHLAGYKRIGRNETLGGSIRYFNLGSMQFTDINGTVLQDFNPREFAIDLTYSRKLTSNFSIAPAFRFIHSNLAGAVSSSNPNINARPGNTVAVDVAFFYQNKQNWGAMPITWAWGANISNVGLKITYNDPESRDFIPTNLRLGTALTGEFDEYNKLTFALDVNKLMVPSPQVIGGVNRTPDRTLISGIFGSFTDAPGGLGEELKEVIVCTGLEYWYNDLIAVRGGFFYEHADKGGRQYATLGAGLRLQQFGLNFAYIVPTGVNNPLADTLRFSLLFNFNKKTATEETQSETPSN